MSPHLEKFPLPLTLLHGTKLPEQVASSVETPDSWDSKEIRTLALDPNCAL